MRPMREHGPGNEGLYGMVMRGSPQNYWLWGNELPEGQAPVVAISLEACSPHLVLVGGLTLARDRSHPLRRSRRLGLRIELPPVAEAGPVPSQADMDFSPAP